MTGMKSAYTLAEVGSVGLPQSYNDFDDDDEASSSSFPPSSDFPPSSELSSSWRLRATTERFAISYFSRREDLDGGAMPRAAATTSRTKKRRHFTGVIAVKKVRDLVACSL